MAIKNNTVRHGLHRKIFIGGLIIVLMGLIAGGYVWYRVYQGDFSKKSSTSLGADKTSQSDTSAQVGGKADEASRSAALATVEGKADEAAGIYKQKAEAEADSQKKATFYREGAMAYINNNQFDKALDYALKARDASGDNIASASLLGIIYEKLNDKTKAIEQYQIAVDLFKKTDDPMGRADYYAGRIKELQAK